MQDPTRDEMIEALIECGLYTPINDDFDAEAAIYWFANDWHGGQWSNLYSVLSTSEYRPGAMENSLMLECAAADMYRQLVETFGTPQDIAQLDDGPDSDGSRPC